jgi:dipeptidyl aminopeptidase/acylaminoacyl peptidase
MKEVLPARITACLLAAWLQVMTLSAQPVKDTVHAHTAGKPAPAIPLIERELFFNNPEITAGKLSPDGNMISFLKANKGILNVWVKKIDEPFDQARPVTASEEPLSGYFWTYDSKYILFSSAKGGDENDHIYVVNPLDSADSATGVPAPRNLTPMDSVKAVIYQLSRKDPDNLWIGLNNRDASWFDLYELQISSGKLRLLRQNKDRLNDLFFDWDENLRLASRSAPDGSTEILRLNPKGGSTKIYECSAQEHCQVDRFTKDNSWVYLLTNKTDSQDLIKLVVLDPETKEVQDVEQDPLNKVDFGELVTSELTREPIYTSYTDSRRRIYWRDTSYESDYLFLQKRFPGREISFTSMTKDEQQWLVSTYSDIKLPEVYLYDRASKKLVFQYTPRPKLKAYERYFCKMQPITFLSSDSLEIPAYLTLPKTAVPRSLPLIVLPHGGPWSRDIWGYQGMVQWLANRGYAVLQINFRGSTGYGKKFLNAGNRQWGMLMQDDITWGVKYLISKGTVNPNRVGIFGGSYGGYAVLAGLAFTPGLYEAGVDICGPSNLVTLLNSIPPYWESARKELQLRVGDPSTAEGKELMQKQSPLFSASRIITPLLIVQGANDPRVKKAESDQIVVALRDLGREVEYICAPDEGHGFAKPLNNLAAFARTEVFLGQNLHGRYQSAMKPDAAKRLAEITVDVSTLGLAPKIHVTPLIDLPVPSRDMTDGHYSYNMEVEFSNRKIPFSMDRTIKQDTGTWVVTDKISSRMGDQSDEAVYQVGRLQPISRKSTQGTSTVTNLFNGREITTVSASGASENDTLQGAYLHNGAGFDLILARMPLAVGYQVGLYLVGQDGKAKLYQLKVDGKDSVNNTECLTLNLSSTEDEKNVTRLWINMQDKIAYKIVVPLSAIPGAKMTMILKK